MYFSELAMRKVIQMAESMFKPTLLDAGCGDCKHSIFFCKSGISVDAVDIEEPKFTHENFNFMHGFFDQMEHGKKYDFVWASHILEHTLNPQDFLVHAKEFLRENGWLCITVPPLKHQIVGGHVNLFNAGIILYRAVLAGFDCKNAKVKQYGYNISIFIQNSTNDVDLTNLKYDCGDIETISKYLPEGYNYQGFNGDVKSLSWD